MYEPAKMLKTADYERFEVVTETGELVAAFEGTGPAGRALPGDRVHWDGEVCYVAERAAHKGIVGTLELTSKSRYGLTSRGVLRFRFTPVSESYPPFFVGCSTRDLTKNLLVRVNFEDWPTTSTCPIGSLTQTIGPAGDLKAEEEALLLHYGPLRWKKDEVALPAVRPNWPHWQPVDSTQLDTFHVDPEGCRDIDDAISIVEGQEPGQRIVKIHIADVVSWLRACPGLEKKAQAIGQTLYRDGGAVRPMFPGEFSEGCMSLLPGQRRKTWTLTIGEGEAYPAWSYEEIIVKESYTYDTFYESRWAPALREVASRIKNQPLHDSHDWIAELMLLYNREAAKVLKRVGAGVLRRHAAPDQELYDRMQGFGLPAKMLAMRAGEYCAATEEETTHWGIGTELYCHASSPIRRWADCCAQAVLASSLGATDPLVSVDISGLNGTARRAKQYERDLQFVRLALAPGFKVTEGTVVEKGKVYLADWGRIVRAETEDMEPGTPVIVRAFSDPSKRNWKRRLVFEVRGAL